MPPPESEGSDQGEGPPGPRPAPTQLPFVRPRTLDTSERQLWRQVKCTGKVPSGRIGHSVCNAGNGILYLWGGVNEGTEPERGSRYLGDFYRYDFKTKEWSEVELTGAPPAGRAFHSAVMYEGKVIIFGGCNGRGRFNRLSRVNGETGFCEEIEYEGQPPATRYCHTAVEYEGRMLVFGGKCGGRNSNKRLADMFEFNFKDKSWNVVESRGDAPTSRSAHTSVIYGNKMLMFGGRDGEGRCCEDFYEYHLESKVWRKLDQCHQPLLMRARHSAVVHNDSLIIFGGWSGKKKLNDLCMYNLDTNRIRQVHDNDENDTQLPCRRECHSAVVVENTMVLFGGRFRGVFMNDSFEYPLQPPPLKLLLREKILHSGVDFQDPRLGLPPDLISYIGDFKNNFLDSAPPAPP
eukprot:Hpha_TRINITY_DN13804_c0_g1::TRINITY_DN13804_c0_g1_i1::g.69708::m.69708